MHLQTRYKLCIVIAIVIAFAKSVSYITWAEVSVIDKDLVGLNVPEMDPSTSSQPVSMGIRSTGVLNESDPTTSSQEVSMERRSTGVHVRPNESDFAYVMAIDYSDQMTGSAFNLASLRCWVSSLCPDARVVEPVCEVVYSRC